VSYIPNGSGLYVPETLGAPMAFAVTDGTGYARRQRCKHTGFASADDKLIYPPPSNRWVEIPNPAGVWASPPYSVDSTSNATVPAYSADVPDVGDQWTAVQILSLIQACNFSGCAGISIGVMTRLTTGGVPSNTKGYFGAATIKTDGTFWYQLGYYDNGEFIQVETSLTIEFKYILLKTTGVIPNIIVSLYKGNFSDFINNTMTLVGSFTHNPVSTLFNTGRPAVYESSGSAAPQHGLATQSHWLAGQIGAC